MKYKKFLGTLLLAIILSLLAVAIPAKPVQAQTIICTPSTGTVGTSVTVTGSGFTAYPSQPVYILFDYTYVSSATVAINGAFSAAPFQVPAYATAGVHYITVQHTTFSYDPGTQIALTSFTVVIPEITLNVTTGYVGDQINIVGTGFTASTAISFYWDTQPLTDYSATIAIANGSFMLSSFTIPASSRGSHTLNAQDTSGRSASATFTVSPQMTADPVSGAAGDQIAVSGTGFTASSAISFYWDDVVVAAAAPTTDTSGGFTLSGFTVPTSSRGSHTLKAQDASGSVTVTFTVSSRITVNPVSGTVGDQVTVSGISFTASSLVSFYWDNVVVAAAATATDASGSFTLSSFTIPASSRGSHTLKAQDTSGSATANFTISQKMAISPETGSLGAAVAVTGTGFGASKTIAITFKGQPVTTEPAAVTTDANGSFTASFKVPPVAAGTHPVVVGHDTYTRDANFTIVVNASISSSSGDVGSEITISGTGFLPDAPVTVSYDDTKMAEVTAGADGTFSATIEIPASSGGEHTITATDNTNPMTFTFTMETDPPEVPAPLLPEMGIKTKALAYFDWEDVTDPSGVTYTLQIGADPDFNNVVLQKEGLTESEYTLTEEEVLASVSKDEPYYWRVKAIDGADNESRWTGAGSFYIGFVFNMPSWALYALCGVGALFLFVLGFWLGRRTAYY